jgi:dTDP-4-amino-4,6-dideoxygalactose transaminase
LYKQECYKNLAHISLQITEKIHDEVISLPMSPVMSIEDVEKIVAVLNKF